MALVHFFQRVRLHVFFAQDWLVIFRIDHLAQSFIGRFIEPLEAQECDKSVIFIEFGNLRGDRFPVFVGSFFRALKGGGGEELHVFFIAEMAQAGFDIFKRVDFFRFAVEYPPINAFVRFSKTLDRCGKEGVVVF